MRGIITKEGEMDEVLKQRNAKVAVFNETKKYK
jgi:hypothetical protein